MLNSKHGDLTLIILYFKSITWKNKESLKSSWAEVTLGLFWFWFKNPGVPGNLWAKIAVSSDCEGEESIYWSWKAEIHRGGRLFLVLRFWQAKKAPTTQVRKFLKFKIVWFFNIKLINQWSYIHQTNPNRPFGIHQRISGGSWAHGPWLQMYQVQF